MPGVLRSCRTSSRRICPFVAAETRGLAWPRRIRQSGPAGDEYWCDIFRLDARGRVTTLRRAVGLGVAAGGADHSVRRLGVGQLVAGITGPKGSPVVAVGEAAIGLSPPPVKNFAITEFGSHDKPVLVIGILVVLALFAAADRRRWPCAALATGWPGWASSPRIGLDRRDDPPGRSAADVLPALVGGRGGGVHADPAGSCRGKAPAGGRPDPRARPPASPGGGRSGRPALPRASPPPGARRSAPGRDRRQSRFRRRARPSAPPGRSWSRGAVALAWRQRWSGRGCGAPSVPCGAARPCASPSPALLPGRPAPPAHPRPERRSSRRTPPSTGWTPHSSCPRSRPTAGSCASTAWSSGRSRSASPSCCAAADRGLRHPDLRVQPGRRPVHRQRQVAGRQPGQPAARGRPRAGADQLLCTSVDGFTSGTPVAGRAGRPGRAAGGGDERRSRCRSPTASRSAWWCRACTGTCRPPSGSPTSRSPRSLPTHGYWAQRGWSPQAPIKTESRIDVPTARRHAAGRPRSGGRRRLGAAQGHRRGRGPGRPRAVARGAAGGGARHRHLAAVGVGLGRHAG